MADEKILEPSEIRSLAVDTVLSVLCGESLETIRGVGGVLSGMTDANLASIRMVQDFIDGDAEVDSVCGVDEPGDTPKIHVVDGVVDEQESKMVSLLGSQNPGFGRPTEEDLDRARRRAERLSSPKAIPESDPTNIADCGELFLFQFRHFILLSQTIDGLEWDLDCDVLKVVDFDSLANWVKPFVVERVVEDGVVYNPGYVYLTTKLMEVACDVGGVCGKKLCTVQWSTAHVWHNREEANEWGSRNYDNVNDWRVVGVPLMGSLAKMIDWALGTEIPKEEWCSWNPGLAIRTEPVQDEAQWQIQKWARREEHFTIEVCRRTRPPAVLAKVSPRLGPYQWDVCAFIYPSHWHFSEFSGYDLSQPATYEMPLHGGCSFLRYHYAPGDTGLEVASVQAGSDYGRLGDEIHSHDAEGVKPFRDAEALANWLLIREAPREDV